MLYARMSGTARDIITFSEHLSRETLEEKEQKRNLLSDGEVWQKTEEVPIFSFSLWLVEKKCAMIIM